MTSLLRKPFNYVTSATRQHGNTHPDQLEIIFAKIDVRVAMILRTAGDLNRVYNKLSIDTKFVFFKDNICACLMWDRHGSL